MPRDDSWLRPSRRDHYNSISDMPLGEWLRRTRTPSGMDDHEQELARALEQRHHQLNDAAATALDTFLHGKQPRKAE